MRLLDGPRVLVTDAHSTSALGVVRSLGAQRMRVTVAGEEGRFNLAAHSRYIARAITCAPAEERPLQFADRIGEELQANRYDLLIPVTDTSVTIISRQRERFDALTTVALPPEPALRAALDKGLTVKVAEENGVAVPRTWRFDSMAALEVAARDLSYPCVVKPRFSRCWDGVGKIVRGSVHYATSPEALLRVYRERPHAPDLFLVQELVTGTGTGVFVLADHGTPVALFAHKRLRESSPTGGRASLAESLPLDARLVEPATRILKALAWHGVAMVEFKDPGEPHPPVLMEVNGRFWGSLPLALAAGVDFPALLASLIFRGSASAPHTYAVGVRCRHLKGDLGHLAAVLKGRPKEWTGPFPGRLETIAAMTPWPGRWRPYNFRLSDPLPALLESWHVLAEDVAAVARLARRKASSRLAHQQS